MFLIGRTGHRRPLESLPARAGGVPTSTTATTDEQLRSGKILNRWTFVRSALNAVPVATCVVVLMIVSGCTSSPLKRASKQELRRSLLDSVARETAEAATRPDELQLRRYDKVSELVLKPDLIPELEAMGGPNAYDYSKEAIPTHNNLLGEPQQYVEVSLERAVGSAVHNNLQIQFARLAPAINESQVVAAAAVFDWVFFNNLNWASTDEPRTAPSIGGQAVGLTADQRQIATNTTGLRKALVSGGQLTLQQELQYQDVNTPNLTEFPDPSWRLQMAATIDQPLLRNFGSNVALAQVRLNRNAERSAVADLKRQLLETITTTEEAYWELVAAQSDVLIIQNLVDVGIVTRDKVRARELIDATPAAISDAVARVQNREAQLIQAKRALRTASDRLKSLMNDPDLTIGSEVQLLPSDAPVDQSMAFSVYDAIVAAVRNRPEVQQALLSIDDTSIRQEVADNQRLPELNAQLGVQWTALNRDLGTAYGDVFDGNFVNYVAGLVFEQPIGNRGAEAVYRQRQLERQQATISYRNTIQQIMLELKSVLADLVLNFDLIEQRRAARLAAAESLRAFEAALDLTTGYSVTNLDILLNRQEQLAQRERDEVRALVDYNTSVARYYSATGTALQRNGIQFVVPDAEEAFADGKRRPMLPTGATARPGQ